MHFRKSADLFFRNAALCADQQCGVKQKQPACAAAVRCPEKAAEIIYKKININDEGPAVLVKGGHSINCANDYLYTEIGTSWFEAERVDNPNTHGTGCTLSSAIACNIAEGYSVKESVARAKEYITGALKAGLNIGKGSGPLNHMYVLDK